MTDRFSDFFLEDADPASLINYIRRLKGNVQQQGLSMVDINIIDFLPPSITQIINNGGAGDVTGPASAVGGSLAIFDGETGKKIKNGGIFTPFNAGLNDGEYSGEIETGIAGEELFYGQIVFQWLDENVWYAADASTDSTSKYRLGVCVSETAIQYDPIIILTRGIVRADTQFYTINSSLRGSPVFLSTIKGGVDYNPPQSAGEIVRIIGYAMGNQTITTIYFDPSNDYYEIG